MKTIFKKVLGVILIIIGVFALLTPLTPGSWLALIGMELLGIHLVVFKRFLNEKQRAALQKFMAKFHLRQSPYDKASGFDKPSPDRTEDRSYDGQVGIKPPDEHNAEKSDKTKDTTKKF